MKKLVTALFSLAVAAIAYAQCQPACFTVPNMTLGTTAKFQASCVNGHWSDSTPVFAGPGGATTVWVSNSPNPANMTIDNIYIEDNTYTYVAVTWQNVAPRPGNLWNWRGNFTSQNGYMYNVQSSGTCNHATVFYTVG
jgi:hypothetical protein